MSGTPGFRQYDLFIDGQSFFTMPKAYELGIRGQIPSHARVPGSYGGYNGSGVRGPSTREQEDADLQRAISASLQESRQFLANKERDEKTAAAPAPVATAGLMDFAGQQGPPQPATADSQTVMSYNTVPPSYGYGAPPPQYASPPPQNPYQPAPAFAAQPPPPAYQTPPASSNALVPSAQPSNPYGAPPYGSAPPAQQPPAPVAPVYAAPPAPAGPPAYAPAQPAPVYGGAPAQPPAAIPTGDLFAPPPVDAFAPVAPPAGDPFGFSQPMPPVDDPFAPKPPPPPTRDDITNSVRLSAFSCLVSENFLIIVCLL